MPRIWLAVFECVVLLGLILVGEASAVPGCPFCAPTEPPFSHRLAECSAAVQATWVSLVSDEASASETTTFEIVEIVKSGETTLQKGSRITIPYGRDGQPGDLFLLFQREGDEGPYWEKPLEITELRFEYIRQAPSPESPDRLGYFLKFLELSDTEIAGDAFAEFSRAQYKDVAALAPKLPREKLRRWLASTDPPIQVRLGLYGMMLGLSGDDRDADFLESLILSLPDPERPRFGIDGMMAGYVMLRRERGLEKLLTAKFDDPRAEDDLLPIRNALTFLWDYSPNTVSAESLRKGMRRFLDQPRLAASVLGDLARWKDWTVLDRLVNAYGHPPFDTDLTKQDIVRFALVCERDGLKVNPQSPPPTALKAREFLKSLDPEWVRSIERNLGGLPRPAARSKASETSTEPTQSATKEDGR